MQMKKECFTCNKMKKKEKTTKRKREKKEGEDSERKDKSQREQISMSWGVILVLSAENFIINYYI